MDNVMTKPLRSSIDKTEIAKRRFASKTGGLGFWAAVDYIVKDPFTKLVLAKEVNKKHQRK